jgi:hypothetical protein
VASHPAVGVDDDLAAGEAGIGHWAAEHKASTWIDEQLGLSVD